jgi:hypothetical protein
MSSNVDSGAVGDMLCRLFKKFNFTIFVMCNISSKCFLLSLLEAIIRLDVCLKKHQQIQLTCAETGSSKEAIHS